MSKARNQFCECGRPVTVKHSNAWKCERCKTIEEQRHIYMRKNEKYLRSLKKLEDQSARSKLSHLDVGKSVRDAVSCINRADWKGPNDAWEKIVNT